MYLSSGMTKPLKNRSCWHLKWKMSWAGVVSGMMDLAVFKRHEICARLYFLLSLNGLGRSVDPEKDCMVPSVAKILDIASTQSPNLRTFGPTIWEPGLYVKPLIFPTEALLVTWLVKSLPNHAALVFMDAVKCELRSIANLLGVTFIQKRLYVPKFHVWLTSVESFHLLTGTHIGQDLILSKILLEFSSVHVIRELFFYEFFFIWNLNPFSNSLNTQGMCRFIKKG